MHVQTELTRLLVARITGLTEERDGCYSRQIDRFVDHVLVTYRNRFLDVNRHSVWRSIEGLCRKLSVHSQADKSADLKSLCERFVGSDVFIGIDRDRRIEAGPPMTADVEYSLLSLLIHLANHPTEIIERQVEVGDRHSDVDSEMESNDQKENDVFRESLLAELVQHENLPDSLDNEDDGDELSDWSDVAEEEEEALPNRDVQNESMDIIAHPSNIRQPRAYDHPLGSDRKSLEHHTWNRECRAWLSRNVAPSYWNDGLGSSQPTRRSTLSSSATLRSRWEAYIEQNCVVRTISEAIELTETQIVRETIWLLQGRQHLYVFENRDRVWSVRDGLAVSHLTQRCLRRLLDSFVSCGQIFATLRRFVEQTTNLRQKFVCRTYEAYASVMATFLAKFEWVLCQMEKTCAEQNSSLTLLALFECMRPWFAKLRAAERIHEAGITSLPTETSAVERAVRLQTELYSALIRSSVEGLGSDNARHTAAFLLSFFCEVIRPYLEMIDSWVTLGRLRDDYDEFLFARNANVATSDEKFWEAAIVVRSRGPPFLSSTLNDLIITGKSTELLSRLGRLDTLSSTEQTTVQPQLLHEVFAERLWQELGRSPSSSMRPDIGTVEVVRHDDSQCRSSDTSPDPLWQLILASNFRECSSSRSSVESIFLEDENVDEDLNSSVGRHLCDVICQCMDALIRSRCRVSCAKLVSVLDKEFGLSHHLSSIRKFYLMEAGDVMFHFYSQLFDKIPTIDVENREVHAKMILEDVLTCYAVPESSRLSIKFDEEIAAGLSDGDLVHRFDALKLTYKVSWPLHLVVSPRMWGKYDRIFSILLRVKYTKYALDELRFGDLTGRADLKAGGAGLLTRVHVTRMKLLHFVNGFHEFLMVRLLFHNDDDDDDIRSSTVPAAIRSLQDVMDEQADQLKRIEERCLLHPKTKPVLDAVTDVFNSAFAFRAFWKGTGTNLDARDRQKILSKVDYDLRYCGRFLVTLLRKSTSSPRLLTHLESLVWTLAVGGDYYGDGDNVRRRI